MYKKKLTDIDYPIFPIRTHRKIWTKDNITYVETDIKVWELDNKNLNGKTLAHRRLKIKNPYPLRPAIFTFAQLIRHLSKTKLYIDVYGKVFKYIKTKRCKLEYKRVINYETNNGLVAFRVEGVNHIILADNYTIEKLHNNNELWLGLLWYNNSWVFYETSVEAKKSTWRKV